MLLVIFLLCVMIELYLHDQTNSVRVKLVTSYSCSSSYHSDLIEIHTKRTCMHDNHRRKCHLDYNDLRERREKEERKKRERERESVYIKLTVNVMIETT